MLPNQAPFGSTGNKHLGKRRSNNRITIARCSCRRTTDQRFPAARSLAVIAWQGFVAILVSIECRTDAVEVIHHAFDF